MRVYFIRTKYLINIKVVISLKLDELQAYCLFLPQFHIVVVFTTATHFVISGGLLMDITFSKTKDIDKEQLCDLFRSVDWESANYPDKLYLAIKGSHTVISAWDGEMRVR